MTEIVKIDNHLEEQPEDSIKKTSLNCSGICRYHLLFLLIAIAIPVVPLFFKSTLLFLCINLYYSLYWIIFVIAFSTNLIRIGFRYNEKSAQVSYSPVNKDQDYLSVGVTSKDEESSKSVETFPYSGFNFCFMIFCYKEPIELITETLKNISLIKYSNNFIVVVAMEERTPDKEDKIKALSELKYLFKQMVFTIHPYGIPGEIPGKCSNSNYALRSFADSFSDLDPKKTLVCNIDVDSRFHPNFLNSLMNQVYSLKEEDLHSTVFQPALFYNMGLDKVSIFSRVTGILRNSMTLGSLVTFDLNIMSIYCATLELLKKGN